MSIILIWIALETLFLIVKYLRNSQKFLFSATRLGVGIAALIDVPIFTGSIFAIIMTSIVIYLLLKFCQAVESRVGRKVKKNQEETDSFPETI